MRTALLVAFLLAMTGYSSLAADTVRLHAAGSLKAALTELAQAFTAHHGTPVETTFGASGLLRQRIEGGEAADLFASANLEHPRALAAAGRGSAVVLFARNQLCALAQPDLAISTATMLDVLSDPDVILGTSTPKADPSGDYAWTLFRRAEAIRPGSYDLLAAKARQLTGGPDLPKAPDGRNTYGWVMAKREADVFLTYCTNAVAAAAEVEGLQVVPLPESLAVGADYGLIVLNEGSPTFWNLAMFILSPDGQQILSRHGFTSTALPRQTE